MQPLFFPTPADFRKWLAENHQTAGELLVGFYKVGSGKPSITWSESVDQALCFGWIDGIRRSIDAESYSIRFTPRRPRSIWSDINIRKVEEMKKLGLMQPPGLEAYEKRTQQKTGIYSYENSPQNFSPELEEQFRSNSVAWDFFQKQAPSYKKTAIFWVMSGKQEATRLKRLSKLMADSASGKK